MAEFASHAVGTAGLTTGIIGTALGALNGGLGLLGGMGGMIPSNQYVSKESFDLAQKNSALQSELAILKADQNTEIKIADVFERLSVRIRNLEDKQNEKWYDQGVYNATNTATTSVMANQLAQLQSLTKLIVPATSVCPEPMPLKNSWTAPTA